MAQPAPQRPGASLVGTQVNGLPMPTAGDLRPWPRYDVPDAVRKRVGTGGALPQYRLGALGPAPYKVITSTPTTTRAQQPLPLAVRGPYGAPVPNTVQLAPTALKGVIRTAGPVGGPATQPSPARNVAPSWRRGVMTPPPPPAQPGTPRTQPGVPGKAEANWALGLGIIALALSLLLLSTPGSVVVAVLIAIPGIVLGHLALKRMKPGAERSIRDKAAYGLILGYSAIVLRVILLLVLRR